MTTSNYGKIEGQLQKRRGAASTAPGTTAKELASMPDHSIPNSTTESIPYGYCHCGCGGQTTIAAHNDAQRGRVKGRPVRFIRGHHRRVLASRPPVYDPDNRCYLIPLTRGEVSKVSPEDIERVGGRRWCVSGNGYAVSRGDGSRTHTRLHRLILNAPDNLDVDHINGDRLDNRRENLRLASKGQNARNSLRPKNNTSGYKGVSRCAQTGKWQVKIARDGIQVHVGRYADKVEAARAYDVAAIELHGDFAALNFPDEINKIGGER